MLLDPLPQPERPAREGGAPPQRTSKRRPQVRLRAIGDDTLAVADWASLHGDLARRPSGAPETDAPVEWRVHDRTHVEFAIDYPLGHTPSEHTWEAYFFVPESFRLHDGTYDKKAIYDDLWSYVRYAVPTVPFYQLASLEPGSQLSRVRESLLGAAGKEAGSAPALLAMRRLRLFACLVRASGLSAMRDVERNRTEQRAGVASFVGMCGAVANALRGVIAAAQRLPDDAAVASRWTDEDVSLVLETFCATLGIALEAKGCDDAAEQLASYAVKEARHRRDCGYDSVGSASADERGSEHFEFRRHLLKRFTASVLWLSLDVRQAATWLVHTLYALAAATAMTTALAMSFGHSTAEVSFVRYALPIIVAYVIRDRTKALLQTTFSGWIGRHFPDRKWSIRDHERGRRVGKVHERAAFLPFRSVPEAVLARRRLTRTHALEEQARPERVLWHQKTVVVDAEPVRDGGTDFSMLTEIFRLNLHRWLTHTDDPNRKVVFADPEDALVYQVTTRRVYNISVVYRLRSRAPDGKPADGKAADGKPADGKPADELVDAPWHRIRVVVSRKGIERIDSIC
jgi:hypothetical protein